MKMRSIIPPEAMLMEWSARGGGRYTFTGSVGPRLDRLQLDERAAISGWIREENDLGNSPQMDTTRLPALLNLPAKGVAERLSKLLRALTREQGTLSGEVRISSPAYVSRTYSENLKDVETLTRYLADQGLVWSQQAMGGDLVRVLPKGFIEAEKSANSSVSRQGFIAMWFHESMEQARNDGLMPGVREAGYVPVLVSDVEHVGKIDDQIIAEIRKSRFVVADFTDHRGGVYFEAGFAMGLGLPVIWTCRRDDLPRLHFDIRQYNCIDWQDPSELAQRLQRRIEAVVGPGPVGKDAA